MLLILVVNTRLENNGIIHEPGRNSVHSIKFASKTGQCTYVQSAVNSPELPGSGNRTS